MADISKVKIGIVVLGYVGLPLAVEFGKYFPTVGFDINHKQVEELSAGVDHTEETSPEEIATATQLSLMLCSTTRSTLPRSPGFMNNAISVLWHSTRAIKRIIYPASFYLTCRLACRF